METGFRSSFRSLLKASVAFGVVVGSATASAAFAADNGQATIAVTAAAGPVISTLAAGDEAIGVDEVVVVGSRLSRAIDGPAPVTIFDREKIDTLGVSSVADVLNYLPQQPFSLNDGLTANGARNVQLRGLANGTTLVLVNGRRTVPGAGGVTGGAFDLNIIPLAAVERVEVLSDSASAVYGADAVGGVINIVLKANIRSPVLDVYYGAADGGAAEERTSLSLGGKSERAQGSIVVDYFQKDPLFGAARDVGRDTDFRRYGGVDRRVLTANPGNICAASGNLPGLSTPCAAVPVGSTGAGLTPASFIATAGQQNFESIRQFASLVSQAKRYSAMANGDYELTNNASIFANLFYTDRLETQPLAYRTIANGTVSAVNPFNPFGVAVRSNFLLDGLSQPKNVGHEKVYSATLGAKGKLNSWDWELAAIGSQSSQVYQTYGNIDATRLAAALASSSTSSALNVFQDGPGGSPSLLTSLVQDPSANAASKTSDQLQFSVLVRGELFALPGGKVRSIVGGEWREEAVSYITPSVSIKSDAARRESSSIFSEINIPIVGRGGRIPLVHDLDITIAGRYDHYSDFGGTFNAQYGATWHPISTVLLRMSYGDSFRAPVLYMLNSPRTLTRSNTFSNGDPKRNNETIIADYVSGGNPDLNPETSTTTSYGVVWTPNVVGNPRIVTSFWRIQQEQRIVSGVNVLGLINNEQLFPERVVRAPRTAADIAANVSGKITFIDASLVNLGSLDTSGFDIGINANFSTRFGRFSPSIAATRVNKFKAADYPSAPIVDRVGVANTGGSIPQWKGSGTLTWAGEGVSVTTAVRYTSSYDDAASTNVRNGRKVDAQTLVDLQMSVNVGELVGLTTGLTSGLVARIGAFNVFNTQAPFSDIFGYGFDPSQGDIRERFVYLALSKTF